MAWGPRREGRVNLRHGTLRSSGNPTIASNSAHTLSTFSIPSPGLDRAVGISKALHPHALFAVAYAAMRSQGIVGVACDHPGEHPKLSRPTSTHCYYRSGGCMWPQSSTAQSTMEVRPPKFLHGFGRAQGTRRPSPNAGTAADGTRSQPFSQAT